MAVLYQEIERESRGFSEVVLGLTLGLRYRDLTMMKIGTIVAIALFTVAFGKLVRGKMKRLGVYLPPEEPGFSSTFSSYSSIARGFM